jgi:hypothetical protein
VVVSAMRIRDESQISMRPTPLVQGYVIDNINKNDKTSSEIVCLICEICLYGG